MNGTADKFKYSMKDIIATLVGAALFVFAEWIEMHLIMTSVIPREVYEWVQLRVLVIALVGVFFGPISGMLCGLGGDLLINRMFEPMISYPEVLVLGLYGFIMGYCKYHLPERGISPKDIADFNARQIVAGIFCGIFAIPMTLFLLDNMNIYTAVTIGARSTIGNSVIVAVVCSIAIVIVGAVRSVKYKKDSR